MSLNICYYLYNFNLLRMVFIRKIKTKIRGRSKSRCSEKCSEFSLIFCRSGQQNQNMKKAPVCQNTRTRTGLTGASLLSWSPETRNDWLEEEREEETSVEDR